MSSTKARNGPPSSRLPAPSLFVGPPSHNASSLSLSKISPSVSNNSPAVAVGGPPTRPTTSNRADAAHDRSTSLNNTARASKPPFRPTEAHPLPPRSTNAQTDAQWADLQSTLSDIELSASSSSHVFGASHAAALEELRKAQVELARAWTKSEDAEEEGMGSEEANARARAAGPVPSNASSGGGEKDGGKGRARDRRRSSLVARGEEDGESDLNAAALRRTANEKYFARVKGGVQDVVARLEAVSTAMRAVEMESRDIWGEGESVVSGPSRNAS